MTDLRIAVNQEYFDQMQSGAKKEEYRLVTPYWEKRLVGKNYERLIITAGYPKADDFSRILIFPYRGYEIKTISHKHFGDGEKQVFAIGVES